jgi:uncharacterized protein YeaO (DUF488 family)
MSLRTKRWDDPPDPQDGFRLLVARYRPRGVSKQAEAWDEWWPQLGPSRELHAAYYGKAGEPISWETYRARYLEEVAAQSFRLRALEQRLHQGETITLLCSSHCTDPTRCHRTLLADLLTRMRQRRKP